MSRHTSLRWSTWAALLASLSLGLYASPHDRGGQVMVGGPPQGGGTQDVQVVIGARGAGAGVNVGPMMGNIDLSIPVEANGSAMLVGQVIEPTSRQPVSGAIVTLGGGAGGGGGRMMVVNGAISMGGPGGGNVIPRVMTDSEGRFAFRSVPKGSFQLTVRKPGYLDGAHGRYRPDGVAVPLEVEDGERVTDLTLRLFKPAAISGAVVDERGEPVVAAQIRAYRRGYVGGLSRLQPAGVSAQTDDRGTYRLIGLTPGDYVVAVVNVISSAPAALGAGGRMPANLIPTMMAPGNPDVNLSLGGGTHVPGDDRFVLQGGSSGALAPEADGRLLLFPTTYHPSAIMPAQAQAVAVRSGEEHSGADITLTNRPTASISGTLSGPDGPAGGYALHLVPADTGDLSADPDAATAITADDGTFLFPAVPSGNYVIQTVRVPQGMPRTADGMRLVEAEARVMVFTATAAGAGAPPPPPPNSSRDSDQRLLFTSSSVSVGDRPVAGLSLALREGTTLTGRLEFKGGTERPAGRQLTSIGIAADGADGRARNTMPPAMADASGQFKAAGLLPGSYRLRAVGLPNGWVLDSIMVGGVDAADQPIEIGTREVSGVVVTLTDKIARVSGTVRAGQGLDPAAAVILFPADLRGWRDVGLSQRRLRMVRATKTGTYTIAAVPPGDYHLIAVSEEFAGDWQDPTFLERVAPESTAITVGEGQTVDRDLARKEVRPAGGNLTHAPAALTSESGDVEGAVAHGPFVGDDEPARSTPQARDARVSPTAGAKGTATVSGVVVLDGASGTPVRRARVALRGADQRVERAVMTDDEGRFVLQGVTAGRYSLSASKPAHVTGHFGARRPGAGLGAPVAVNAGQNLTGLSIRIAPGGVLAGRVLDETGQPFPGVAVRLMQFRTVNGERLLAPAGGGPGPAGAGAFATTDDRGEYRLFGLAAGDYVVSATAPGRSGDLRQLSTDDVQQVVADLKTLPARNPGGGAAPGPDPKPLGGRAVGYAPVFYPGTSVASQAQTVTVTPGAALGGIDFMVRMVPTSKVSGIVNGADGRPAGGLQLFLVPADLMAMSTSNATSLIRTAPDGTFSSAPLPPGRYTISGRTGSGNTSMLQMGGDMAMFTQRVVEERVAGTAAAPPTDPPVPMWTQAEVELAGQDVTGLTLQLQEGMTVSGKLVFNRTTAAVPEDLTRVRLGLQTAGPTRMMIGQPTASLDATGTFTFSGVAPGTYRITATVPPPAGGFSATSRWVLDTVMANGRDVADTGLTVAPGQGLSGITANFTDLTTELSGKLTDAAGRPVSDLSIVVFTTDRALWTQSARRNRAPTQPDSEGEFRFAGLPPGEYYLAAVTELAPDQWGDPAVMEQIVAAAIRITLAPGEKKVQMIQMGSGFAPER